jgi:hypothetical protein
MYPSLLLRVPEEGSIKDYTFHKFLCTFFDKIKCFSGSEMINCGYMSLSD